MKDSLFSKYDIPAPRYTSYPTVPYWESSPEPNDWIQSLKRHWKGETRWSMYIHVPFCESLCTFCGCNTSITKDHKHESPYVDAVLNEMANYRRLIGDVMVDSPLCQLHIGGGTPTFLSAEQLDRLVGGLTEELNLSEFEGSFEVDPRKTQKDQLEVLYSRGFRRVSLGVQDFDPIVQQIVNRVQPFDITEKLTKQARDIGYRSINYDLIYGLPKQTLKSIDAMIEQTIQLRPDRIALYSFAKVPWIKPAQRLFKDEDIPEGGEKRALYESARGHLLDAGYLEVGMDHFALPTDSLAMAMNQGKLHRNFMGYTEKYTEVLLGLGVSSISESPDCFHQNEKRLPVYLRKVGNEVPTLRGHMLTKEDRIQRKKILQLMTRFEVELEDSEEAEEIRGFLSQMIDDDLVELSEGKMRVTEKGRPFLRNACMALDLRLRSSAPDREVFSRSL